MLRTGGGVGAPVDSRNFFPLSPFCFLFPPSHGGGQRGCWSERSSQCLGKAGRGWAWQAEQRRRSAQNATNSFGGRGRQRPGVRVSPGKAAQTERLS
jgi:hypothetical protein